MLLPAIFFLLAFVVVPFVISIRLSFTDTRLIQGPIPPKWVGFRNFSRILGGWPFWHAFLNVLWFTAMVIPIQCGFALLMAVLLNSQRRAKNFFRGLYFVPFITPMVVVCVIWATIYQYPSGVFNSLVNVLSFGLAKPVEWLGNPGTAMPAITGLSAWQAYGFQMVIYLAGLQNIPEELYEAAEIDGASGWRRFVHVTWPSLAATNVFILIITTIQALKLFTQVNILTHGGPRDATNTLVQYIYRNGFVAQNVGYASAASLLLFLLVLGIYLLQQLAVRRYGE